MTVDPFTIVLVAIIGLVLLSIPAMLIVGLRRQSQRSRGLQEFAAKHGFTYARHDRLPDEIRPLLERARAIPQGWKLEHIRNVMKGRHAGADLLVFDCQYTKTGQVTACTVRLFATIACVRRDKSFPWTFVWEAKTGGTQYLEVGGMLAFINDAAARFGRSATA